MSINTIASFEVSEGNEDHVIRNWRRSDPCYEVAEN